MAPRRKKQPHPPRVARHQAPPSPRNLDQGSRAAARALRHRDDDRAGDGRAALAPADAQQPHSNATERTLHSHLVECAAARRSLWIEFWK